MTKDLPPGDIVFFDSKGDAVDGYSAQRVREILEDALKPGKLVAWINRQHYLLAHAENMPPADKALAQGWEPLYTAPPAQTQYPLPDDLYDSKCWKEGTYAERVEWLHTMYEAKKAELDAYVGQTPPPRLTDEQVTEIYLEKPRYHYPPIASTDVEFARAIESAVRKQFGVNDE